MARKEATAVDYSVVLPAYNEQARIGTTIEKYCRELSQELRGSGKTFELIVVANGCTDGTFWLVRFLATSFWFDSPVRLVNLPQANKGLAVMEGFRVARGQVVGFTDADGAIPPGVMLSIMRLAERGVVAIGSKYCAGTTCQRKQPLMRRLASRGWYLLVRLLFGLKGVTDTQAGAKAMPAECARTILDRVVPCHFAFDVSLLWEAQKAGYAIVEAPIAWEHTDGSKFKLAREIPRMFWALLRMRFARSSHRVLEELPAEAEPAAAVVQPVEHR